MNDDKLDLIIDLMKCADVWREDAARYFGRRREWRIERAKHLEKKALLMFDKALA